MGGGNTDRLLNLVGSPSQCLTCQQPCPFPCCRPLRGRTGQGPGSRAAQALAVAAGHQADGGCACWRWRQHLVACILAPVSCPMYCPSPPWDLTRPFVRCSAVYHALWVAVACLMLLHRVPSPAWPLLMLHPLQCSVCPCGSAKLGAIQSNSTPSVVQAGYHWPGSGGYDSDIACCFPVPLAQAGAATGVQYAVAGRLADERWAALRALCALAGGHDSSDYGAFWQIPALCC